MLEFRNEVSVVILHYKRGPAFRSLLQTVEHLDFAEAVVVDNGPDGDLTCELTQASGLTYVRSPTNLGYGAGMNFGFQRLTSPTKYVLLLTHEVALAQADIDAMISTAERQGAALVGPILHLPDGGGIWSSGGEVGRSGLPRHRRDTPLQDRRAQWLDGAALLVRTAAFERVGGFDPDYFLYYEDVDLGLRLARHGGAWVSVSATCQQDTNRMPAYFGARNSTLLWRKHKRPLRLAVALARGLFMSLRRSKHSGDRRARLRGLRDGLACGPSRTKSSLSLPGTVNSINPIPLALRHYQESLREVLAKADLRLAEVPTATIESDSWNRVARLGATMSLLGQRKRQPSTTDACPTIVLWPALGFADLLTWRRTARDRTVWVVIHDPVPLRRAAGYSRVSVLAASIALWRRDVRLLVHSEEALQDLPHRLRLGAQFVPLPLRGTVSSLSHAPPTRNSSVPRTVRVLGQCKSERDLGALRQIAAGSRNLRLEIVGRNWPEIEGWSVSSVFVDEETFGCLIATSDCIVIPYQRFYQSDIAVRALESHTPVVAPSQSQTRFLFGDDYAGLVTSENSWTQAVEAVLASDHLHLRKRHEQAVAATQAAWQELIWLSQSPGFNRRWLRPID